MELVKTINCNGNPVYAYSINSTSIYDPTLSECGRFSVNPLEHYGLTPKQVKILIDINEASGYQWEF